MGRYLNKDLECKYIYIYLKEKKHLYLGYIFSNPYKIPWEKTGKIQKNKSDPCPFLENNRNP